MRSCIAVVLVVACASGFPADANSSAAPGPACRRISAPAQLPLRPGGGRLRGDVDGDGRRDRISIRYAPKARTSCGFFLVAETRSRTYAARVPELYKQDMKIREWPFAEPFLAAVVQLDARRAQIVVARSHGAAVVSVSLHGLVRGRLVQLTFRPRFYEDELPLFGTVGTGESNVRCVRGGPLVFLIKQPQTADGRRWWVSRSKYKLSGGVLRRADSKAVGLPRTKAYQLAHRWGMDALPFAGCTVARGRRL